MDVKSQVTIQALALNRRVAKQLPFLSFLSKKNAERLRVLGNLANDAIEPGSDPCLVVNLDGLTHLLRTSGLDSRWTRDNMGPRIILT